MTVLLKQLWTKAKHSPRRTSLSPRRKSLCKIEHLEERLAPSATYFLSPSGNDAQNGLSPGTAWRSLARANAQALEPGNTILLEGGATFNGTLQIWTGDPSNPLTVSSYGVGRATIASGSGRGIWSCSAGGLEIRDLNLVGSGAETSSVSGIELCNSGSWTGPAAHFYIDNVDVTGYGVAGIWVAPDAYGIDDVRITRTRVHHNANGMMLGHGDFDLRVLTNLYIGHVEADNNNRTASSSIAGVGINLLNIYGGVLERSLLHDNGLTSNGPGHAGLLVNSSSYLTVQYNEAYRNADAIWGDGQGFAFCSLDNSVIQYNYSHDNGNGGFEITQDSPDYHSWGVTFRYNISENDGVGIIVFGAVWNTEFHNNTVFTGASAGFRVPVVIMEWTGDGVHFRNNIFQVDPGIWMLIVDEASLANAWDLQFQNNVYSVTGAPGTFGVMMGSAGYYSLADWQNATGQETLAGLPVGSTEDPQLVNPGGGGTIGDPDRLGELNAYQILATSPHVVAGLDLWGLLGIDPGPQDYFGGGLSQSVGFSMGAHQAATVTQFAPTSSSAEPQVDAALLAAVEVASDLTSNPTATRTRWNGPRFHAPVLL